MIALQVAAGILLAYFVIVNQRTILRFSGRLVSLVIVLAVIAAMGAGGVLAFHSISINWWKIVEGVAFCATMIFFVLGGYGLVLLTRRVFRTRRPNLSGDSLAAPLKFIAFTLINILLVSVASWPVLTFTPLGAWYDAADQWSRSIGSADSASILLTSVASLWALIPVFLLSRRETPKKIDEASFEG
jgi:hypothetical protein